MAEEAEVEMMSFSLMRIKQLLVSPSSPKLALHSLTVPHQDPRFPGIRRFYQHGPPIISIRPVPGIPRVADRKMLRRARSAQDLPVVRDIQVNSKQDVKAAVDSGVRYAAMIKSPNEGGRGCERGGKEVKCASKRYADVLSFIMELALIRMMTDIWVSGRHGANALSKQGRKHN
ncbi:hypothetical protein HWV62_34695 [Athelia sp. TMB]|nr:hypothetical protein HWV62_34695 [Athelia sp. TMB]